MPRTIRIGAKGDDVVQLQTALKLEPTGVFGVETVRAVIAFQHERVLVEDGVVGPKTWAAILANVPSADVKLLQEQLARAGFDPGAPDGIMGDKTRAAVTAFQESFDKLSPTGEADAATLAALAQANHSLDEIAGEEPTPDVCSPATWGEFRALCGLVTDPAHPARYGPGRGLFYGGKFVVTFGPGSLGATSWPTHLDHTYPSFHCTSWANFFLGWLLRYDAEYTHAGNIPDLFDLMAATRELHFQKGAGSWRGYAPHTRPILSNGSSTKRLKFAKAMDARELYQRRASLPSFIVCGQSTKVGDGWKWWHHVVVFAIDHRAPGHPMYRIAADGYCDAKGYSGQAMRLVEVDQKTIGSLASAAYMAFGVYDVGDGPRAPVIFES